MSGWVGGWEGRTARVGVVGDVDAVSDLWGGGGWVGEWMNR